MRSLKVPWRKGTRRATRNTEGQDPTKSFRYTHFMRVHILNHCPTEQPYFCLLLCVVLISGAIIIRQLAMTLEELLFTIRYVYKWTVLGNLATGKVMWSSQSLLAIVGHLIGLK